MATCDSCGFATDALYLQPEGLTYCQHCAPTHGLLPHAGDLETLRWRSAPTPAAAPCPGKAAVAGVATFSCTHGLSIGRPGRTARWWRLQGRLPRPRALASNRKRDAAS